MKLRQVKKLLNVCQMTIWRYVKEGKIRYTKINNNHYEYNDQDVYGLIGIKKQKKDRKIVSYSRVSKKDQKDQLKHQTQRIYDFCISKGIELSHQYQDIKSGMNFDRQQFNQLIEKVIKGQIQLVIVENKDRLCRFGFQLLENIFKFYNCKILVINDQLNNKNYQQQITQDLINIIHYFITKMHFNRMKLNRIKKELLQ